MITLHEAPSYPQKEEYYFSEISNSSIVTFKTAIQYINFLHSMGVMVDTSNVEVDFNCYTKEHK